VAAVVNVHSMRIGYRSIVERVRDRGHLAEPRGLRTLDVGPTLLVCQDPRDALAVGVGRGLSANIAAVEAAMLVGGFCDEDLIKRVAPKLLDYADKYESATSTQQLRLHGAYGRRIGQQLGAALHKLRVDPETRQAIITLWDPWLDNLPEKRDYPCTLALQLIMRNGLLDLDVTMRSSDVWRGLPYDAFQFSQLLITAARVLGVPLGRYYHMSWSLHLYATDVEEVDKLLDSTPDMVTSSTFFQPQGFGRPGQSLRDVQRRIHQLTVPRPRIGDDIVVVDDCEDAFTPSEAWYNTRLAPDRVLSA
jgi:thymidylate synthase